MPHQIFVGPISVLLVLHPTYEIFFLFRYHGAVKILLDSARLYSVLNFAIVKVEI